MKESLLVVEVMAPLQTVPRWPVQYAVRYGIWYKKCAKPARWQDCSFLFDSLSEAVEHTQKHRYYTAAFKK